MMLWTAGSYVHSPFPAQVVSIILSKLDPRSAIRTGLACKQLLEHLKSSPISFVDVIGPAVWTKMEGSLASEFLSKLLESLLKYMPGDP